MKLKLRRKYKRHLHIFKQSNILDASRLKCRYGMILNWRIMNQDYKEEEEKTK